MPPSTARSGEQHADRSTIAPSSRSRPSRRWAALRARGGVTVERGSLPMRPQALMLFNIGDAEISVGELMSRGYYLGSNVSYNVKKMIENGYLSQERSVHDRRSIRVRLTRKGRTLREQLGEMYQRHLQRLGHSRITDADLQFVAAMLRELERFWMGVGDA